MAQNMVEQNQRQVAEHLELIVYVSFIFAVLVPPVGFFLGLAKRRDYGQSRPRNQKAATYAAGIGAFLMLAWLVMVLSNPISSLVWVLLQ